MRRRKLVAPLLAVAAMTAAALSWTSWTASPAGAQQAQRPDATLAGNFSGGPEEEVFIYRAGPGADHLVRLSNGGVPGGPVTWQRFPHPVSGSFRPVAGDFDADGYDEIIWYAPGTAPDFIWDFTSDTQHTSRGLLIDGTYRPVAGDFDGNGYDDVFWYGLTGRDFVWYFRAGGFDSVEYGVSYGQFQPVAGSFGVDDTDDVFFYAPGAPDHRWDFHPNRSYTSTEFAQGGSHRAFSLDVFGQGFGGGDIFFYAEGTSPDEIWDFFDGQLVQVVPVRVDGTYTVAAGRLLSDECEDVLWSGATNANLWDFSCTGEGAQLFQYVLPGLSSGAATAAATAGVEPARGPSLSRQG